MRTILSERSRPILEKFASAKVLLAFDFDGTLSPIVTDPDRAAIRGSTRRVLRKLAQLYPCIVVSGRGRSDVLRRVRGIGFKEVVGNHGIESSDSSRDIAQTVRGWILLLRPKLKGMHGIAIEDKTFSISVHYRKARRKKRAVQAITEAARNLPGVRVIGGKQVINIVLRGAPHKGHAVLREQRKRHCDRAMFVGDDETDENAFALSRNGRLLGIRVGLRRSSLADFYIRDQREIDRLLRVLIELRTRAE
ncbi:MAG: trehalose-phosphatase [Candidatus Acidiferrales bacterium]